MQWERYPRFHNLTDDEIANLTIKEFDTHEEERMEMNAWWVAKELANRIDGAPLFNPIQAGLFWNHIGWGGHIVPPPLFLLYLLSNYH